MSGKKLALLTALISGLSVFLNSFAVRMGDPSVFAATKNTFVAAGLLAVLACRRELVFEKKKLAKLALIGLVGGSVPFILFFNGLAGSAGSSAAFIHKMMFAFATVFAVAVLREKVERRFMLFAAGILLGNALLLGLTGFSFGRGEIMVLAATVLWGFEQVLSKSALREMTPVQVGAGRMGFGAIFISVYLAATGNLSFAYDGAQLGWAGVTGVLLFAYVTSWYGALAKEKVSTATAVLSIGSVLTTALDMAFKGIVLTPAQAFGTLVLAGAVCAIAFSDSAPHRHSHSV